MNTFVVANQATGEVVRTLRCPPGQELGQALPGELLIPTNGDVELHTHYLDRQQRLVPYTAEQIEARTARPNIWSRWDNETMTWIDQRPDAERQLTFAEEAIQQRQLLLTACDWTQMPDVPMSDEKRRAWRDYRQALRDLTKQSGFPLCIEWPITPM